MDMPGRTTPPPGSIGQYRYGFNGKENDIEVVGTGEGTQDYGMRIYNPALGRFLSVDPLTAGYPSLSPYPFAMNRPIDGIDIDGMEWIHYVWVDVSKVKLSNGNSEFIFKTKTTGNGKLMECYVYDKTVQGTKDVQWYVFENSKLFKYPYQIPGYTESVKAERERQQRIMKDVLVITGGVVAIVATGGLAAVATGGMSAINAAGLAWTVTSAQMAIVGGTSKLILDLNGKNKELSDKIPTSLGGAVGLTVDYAIGDKKGTFQAIGDLADGVLTFSVPKNFVDGTNAAISITNIVITANDVDNNAKDSKKTKKGK